MQLGNKLFNRVKMGGYSAELVNLGTQPRNPYAAEFSEYHAACDLQSEVRSEVVRQFFNSIEYPTFTHSAEYPFLLGRILTPNLGLGCWV